LPAGFSAADEARSALVNQPNPADQQEPQVKAHSRRPFLQPAASTIAKVNACLICERVALAKEGRNPHLIAEMDHTYFVVGDHQFHQGYALVLLKEHVREPFDLPPHVQREHFREVMRAAEAINNTFEPWKMNFSATATRSHTCIGTSFRDTRTIRTPAKTRGRT
jgi:hypothetical protein